MKRLMILCVAVLLGGAFTACEKDDKGQLDPNAKVYISPAPGVKAVAAENPEHLTARQIVEQAECLLPNYMTIDDWNRDLENNRIIGSSTWVVAQDGNLTLDLITSRDMVLVTKNEQNTPKDTIAYLSNDIMIAAEKNIRVAYDAENYAACYKLFEEAFVFTPITGAEWRELKAQGKN